MKLVAKQEFIENRAFQLNHNKTYFPDSNTCKHPKVRGLLIKENIVKLTKGYRNKIRIYKHMLKTGRVSENNYLRINGYVNHTDFIDSISDLKDDTIKFVCCNRGKLSKNPTNKFQNKYFCPVSTCDDALFRTSFQSTDP